jgi:hypothetical protein
MVLLKAAKVLLPLLIRSSYEFRVLHLEFHIFKIAKERCPG